MGLLLGVIAVAVSCGGEGAQREGPDLKVGPGVTDSKIILGQHTVLSGNLVAVTAPIPRAEKAYFRYINDQGGVCGREIDFRFEDDQYSPARALEVVRRLAEQDQVLAFIGNFGTPAHLGAVDYINDPNADGDTSDGIPDLFLSTGAAAWSDPENLDRWPWTISFIPDYFSEGEILATYVNEAFPGKTVGILYQNDDYGRDGRDGFVSVFRGEVVIEQTYEATAPEISSQIINLREARPDIVYLFSTPAYSAQAISQAHANGWYPQFIASYTNANTTLAALLGGGHDPEEMAQGFQELEGIISTAYLMTVPQDDDDPAVIRHREIMEKYDGPPVTTLSIYGQSVAELTVETLRRACQNGDLTRAGLLRAAESIRGFRTSLMLPGIEINLGPDDHAAIQALQVVRWRADGTLEPLGPVISLE